MTGAAPLQLSQLLHAPDAARREAAWDELIAHHTRILLAVARSFGGGQDATMERYAFMLERLRADDFRRLRAFRADGRASFGTWLTVAARRMCLDHHRARYGRTRAGGDPEEAAALRAVRHRLADSLAVDVDTDALPDAAAAPDRELIRANLDSSLRAAMAALPPRDRLLLALRFDDELPASRIADLLGYTTPFHVYRQLAVVFARLRAALEARGIQAADG